MDILLTVLVITIGSVIALGAQILALVLVGMAAFERIEVPVLSVYQPKRCCRQFRLARHPFDEIVFRVKIHRVAQGINQ